MVPLFFPETVWLIRPFIFQAPFIPVFTTMAQIRQQEAVEFMIWLKKKTFLCSNLQQKPRF